jgi:hypothetical protein
VQQLQEENKKLRKMLDEEVRSSMTAKETLVTIEKESRRYYREAEVWSGKYRDLESTLSATELDLYNLKLESQQIQKEDKAEIFRLLQELEKVGFALKDLQLVHTNFKSMAEREITDALGIKNEEIIALKTKNYNAIHNMEHKLFDLEQELKGKNAICRKFCEQNADLRVQIQTLREDAETRSQMMIEVIENSNSLTPYFERMEVFEYINDAFRKDLENFKANAGGSFSNSIKFLESSSKSGIKKIAARQKKEVKKSEKKFEAACSSMKEKQWNQSLATNELKNELRNLQKKQKKELSELISMVTKGKQRTTTKTVFWGFCVVVPFLAMVTLRKVR